LFLEKTKLIGVIIRHFIKIDGLYICKKSKKIITVDDLKAVQIDLAKGVFGNNIEYKFIIDTFPFTDPSVEMDLMFNGNWMEVNGARVGTPAKCWKILDRPEVYNGWAFGFGDRLAMVKMEYQTLGFYGQTIQELLTSLKT